MDLANDIAEQIAISVWKAFPFRPGNRKWLLILFQGYVGCLFSCFVLACIINSIEGKDWLRGNAKGHGEGSKGQTALDEVTWFVFTTMHGIGFGEFMPRSTMGRIIGMFVCTIGYWLPIYLGAIIILSQLPGEPMPTVCGVTRRMLSAVWPSYIAFMFWIFAFGAMSANNLSKDRIAGNRAPASVGIYWMWTVAHRMPYGDIYPTTHFSRTITVPAAMLGSLYMPFALALIAVRRPTMEQHQSLLDNLRSHPKDAFGRGYSVPAPLKEAVMEEYSPGGGS